MTELAALGVRLDGVSGVDRMRDSLGRFVKSAEDADRATEKLTKDTEKLGKEKDKASKSSLNFASALSIAKAAMGALTAAYGALKLGEFIKDATLLSSRFETMGVVMRIAGNNAGYTMNQMEGFSKSLQQQGISMLQSRNSLTQLATANIDLAKASGLARAAQDLAVVANVNSSEALGRMIHGIKSGEIEILRTLGLNVSFEASYKKLAQSLGITTEALSENQKMQARADLVLEGSARYNGIYEESLTTAGKALSSLTRYWEDFKVKVGDHFLPVFAAAVFGVTDALVALNKAMDATSGGTSGLTNIISNGLRVAFETIIILAGEVAFVINGVYREIVGIAAQAVALAKFDFKGAADIGRMMKEDAAAARDAMDKFAEGVVNRNKGVATGVKMTEAERIAAGKAAREAEEANEKNLRQQAALNAFTKQFGTESEKAALATKEWKNKLGDLWDPKMEAQLAGKGGAAAAKAAQKTYIDLITTIKQKIATNDAELFAAGKLTESTKLTIKLNEELKSGELKLSEKREKKVREGIAILANQEKEQAAIKRSIALNEERKAQDDEVAQAMSRMDDQVNQAMITITEYGRSLTDQIEMTELETKTIGMNAQARQVMIDKLRIEQDLRRRRDIIDAAPFSTDTKRQAAIDALNAEGTRAVALVQRKAFVSEWERTSQMVGDTLQDYLMNGGKNGAEYIQRLFSNMVLQPIVKAGIGALLGTGGEDGEGGGITGNIANLIGMGKNAYSMLNSPMLTNFGEGLANSVNQVGGKLFNMGMEDMGESLIDFSETMAGYADTINMAGSAIGYGKAIYDLTQGKYLSAIGTGIGQWFGGPIGAAFGSMVGGVLDKFFAGDSGTKHMGAGAIYSQATGVQGGAGIYNQGTFGMGHPAEYRQEMQAQISGIAQGLGETLDKFAISFGQEAGYSVAAAFADDSSKDGSWGSFKVVDQLGKVLIDWADTRDSKWAPKTFADGPEGIKEFMNQIAVDMKAPFMAMDAPRWSKDILGVVENFEQLNTALQKVAGIQTLFTNLGKTMEMFADITGETQTRLLYASGGVEALGTNTSAFYQTFFSEEERAQTQRELLMKSLASANLYIDPYQGDAAKLAFRQTVEEAMRSGQIELAAKLMGMSATFGATADFGQQIFDKLADTAKETAKTVEEAAKKAFDASKSLAQGMSGQMESAYNAMVTAGNLLDQIDSAKGGAGNRFSMLREQRLWAAMGEADYKRQIELAGELTDLVLARHQIEQANAERLLDFGKSLRSYVDSLKIGALSPLTSGEKLAEAARQYAETLKKAQSGDEDARNSLQGISSGYLELARNYFASGSDYTKIFNSVTGSLDALGIASQNEAQQQLAVASQSLGKLGELEQILQTAYGQAGEAYGVEKELLEKQLIELFRTANGIEVVSEILSGLPAELAAQIAGSGLVSGIGNYSSMAQGYISLLGGAGGSSTDAGYVAGAMANMNAANWKAELNNALALLVDPAAKAKMQAIFDAVAKMKGIDGSHAAGLGYVPYDNYIAELHEGEEVLTKEQARARRRGFNEPGSDSGEAVAMMATEIRTLNVKFDALLQQNELHAQATIMANVESNQSAATTIVNGVGEAIVRGAYAEQLNEGAKAR